MAGCPEISNPCRPLTVSSRRWAHTVERCSDAQIATHTTTANPSHDAERRLVHISPGRFLVNYRLPVRYESWPLMRTRPPVLNATHHALDMLLAHR